MFDMSNLKKLKTLGQLAPAAWQGFEAFEKAALADGVIPAKMKELMAVAVALTTQCPYCIESTARGPRPPDARRPRSRRQ